MILDWSSPSWYRAVTRTSDLRHPIARDPRLPGRGKSQCQESLSSRPGTTSDIAKESGPTHASARATYKHKRDKDNATGVLRQT